MSRSVHTLCDEKIEQLSADLADARQKLAASESKLALLMDTFAKHQRSTIDSRNDYALNAARAEVEKCDLRAQHDQAVALARGALQHVAEKLMKMDYMFPEHSPAEVELESLRDFIDAKLSALNPPPGDGEKV